MGGSDFLNEPRNPRLARYILRLTQKRWPRICFVPTAAGDSAVNIRRFQQIIKKYPCRTSVLSLFWPDGRDLNKYLLAQDVIYVGGGNTANMLAIWRLHGVDKALRRAWDNGVILCGVSAGMMCWFESGVTDSFGPVRALNDGLAFLSGSACPHFDRQPLRRPTYHRLIGDQTLPAGVAADDGAAIHYVDRKILRCVASRPNARAYCVYRRDGHVLEEPLPTIYLPRDGKLQAGCNCWRACS